MPQPEGSVETAQERQARLGPAVTQGGFPLPDRDVRSKRPPLLM